jgi:tRNA/tmRNA/rRNA uracil-C5-methylase (TrmA/RlmC/RlmD family)
LNLKEESLKEFFKKNKIEVNFQKIESSPKPRKYRTTSKRKIFFENNKFYLGFKNIFNQRDLVQFSLLEPDEHFSIYKFIGELINKPGYKFLARHLNYVIIRGSYNEFAVIFNVNFLNSDIVRKLKNISEELEGFPVKINSAFLYFDPSDSEYYFESKIPEKTLQFKKLFGYPKLTLTCSDFKYFYHPISFSQINESMIGVMLETAKTLLKHEFEERLLDLYCGYGLFSYFFRNDFSEILGIDLKGESINSAIESLKFYKGKSKIRFHAEDINFGTLQKILPKDSKKENIILDPPRLGTKANVTEILAARNPLKILHIFCNIDEIPQETEQWKNNGYSVKAIVPLDMFPGTPNLEIMILLEKNKLKFRN